MGSHELTYCDNDKCELRDYCKRYVNKPEGAKAKTFYPIYDDQENMDCDHFVSLRHSKE